MKILWLVNIIMPELAVHLNKKPTVYGGWLSGALQAVKESGNELVVCTTAANTDQTEKYTVNDVTYYIAKRSTVQEMEQVFKAILELEKPDVVHIYGTEFEHSWAMAKQTDPDRTLVSIQGLVSYIEKHIYNGIPDSVTHDNLLHKVLRKVHKGGNSIELQRSNYISRAKTEESILKRVRYVNAGTNWGEGCVKLINPNANMLSCELILREEFYNSEKWNVNNIDRHTIFTFYSYPVKGFHMFLRALKYVVDRYPDTIVYVAGNRCLYRKHSGLKKRIMDAAPDYDWYIQSLIEKYNLKKNLVFTGYLSAEEVRNRELKTHVFVSASSIENHSTALGEAMITGVPCVSSCVGGLQEMIDHGKDGFLYPFNEPYMLAYYICKIFEDDELASMISIQGKKHASVTYGKEKNKSKLIEMYKTISINN